MAQAAEYGLGPHTFPRGWFIVAEAKELDAGPLAVRFFGKDFALYRGETGKVVMLDAYCAHMGTHLTASKSAIIVADGKQLEGDSIRCPYHGWRYGPDGQLDDIPYHDGPLPKSGAIASYEVREVMNMILMWHDPDSGEPLFEPPYLEEWDDPQWVRWELDHLGTLPVHGTEILDNMADAQHLGPTHGAPCEYFENEFKDHIVIQRQGGFQQSYGCMLNTTTWYTGPGLLLSRQKFGEMYTYELIANTPVDDGVSQCWHAVLYKAANNPPNDEDVTAAKGAQDAALFAFGADFDVWKHKAPAIRVMQMKKDGPFKHVRKWGEQFYADRADIGKIQAELNGVMHIDHFNEPDVDHREFDQDLFAS